MLSEEEKKAISQCTLLLNGDITLHVIDDDDGGTAYCGAVNKEYNQDLRTVLNLVEKQNRIIDNAINEVEKVRQYFDDGLQPEFIGILEILKDKKVIDW